MAFEQRLRTIEKRLQPLGGTRQQPILIVIYDPNKPYSVQSETAIAEYKAKHPEYRDTDKNGFDILYVTDEATKQVTEKIMMGDDGEVV
jgi:hypothetical protein